MLDDLFSAAYEELRRLASAVRRSDHASTRSATTLVNEAWVKLASSPRFTAVSHLHFKRIAARAMRQVLIEAARRRHATKRGGGDIQFVTLDESASGVGAGGAAEILALETALAALAQVSPRQAEMVECRFRRPRCDGKPRPPSTSPKPMCSATGGPPGLARQRAAQVADSRDTHGCRALERLQALFHDAVDRPPAERAPFLRAACGDDPAMVEEVLAAIAEDEQETRCSTTAEYAAERMIGATPERLREIGPYRVVRTIGEGGMGVVFLAERTDLGTSAAVKILRDAWLSPSRRQRFAAEQRTLARLNHPGIARLFDAGTLSVTPWIVMEFVEGVPLTAHVESGPFPIDARLGSSSTCAAVRRTGT